MLTFQFSRVEQDMGRPASGYDLGHIAISGASGAARSEGARPDQGMMIFLSIVELLDGLRRFILREEKKYRFVGADSSFCLSFARDRNGRIKIHAGDRLLDSVDTKDLTESLWLAVQAFVADRRNALPVTDPVLGDIENAISEFEMLRGQNGEGR